MSSCPIWSRSFFNPFALRSASTVILNRRLIFHRESPCLTVYFVDPGGGGSVGASADDGAADSTACAEGGVPAHQSKAINPTGKKRRKRFLHMRSS